MLNIDTYTYYLILDFFRHKFRLIDWLIDWEGNSVLEWVRDDITDDRLRGNLDKIMRCLCKSAHDIAWCSLTWATVAIAIPVARVS